MKFAHLSDCHIGGWREPRLREANSRSFKLIVKKCLEESVDFVLISGDLFNTAVPGIDSLRMAVEQIKKLKDAKIPVYFIAGSHDFSPSGKTMLDVLEHAGLAVNVAKGEELPDNRLKLNFTVDAKTSVKIVGMVGKKGGLETGYYHQLDRASLEQESGFKIFMFHTALTELKPKELDKMDAMAVSLLPSGFDYYAGGHVHVTDNVSLDGYKNIVYPGPAFPNNFSEIEKLRHGSFVIYDNGKISHVPLPAFPVVCISVEAERKAVSEAESSIRKEIAANNVKGAIVTIRVSGCLDKGRPADLNWNDVFHDAYAKGAHYVMKNTNAFTSKELEVISVKDANVEDLEASLLSQHASQFKLTENDLVLAKKLMVALSADKKDGERVADFDARLNSDIDSLFQE